MKYEVTLSGKTRTVDVRPAPAGQSGVIVSLDGGPYVPVDAAKQGWDWRLRVDGSAPARVGVSQRGDDVFVLDGDTPVRGTVVDPRAAALAHGASAGQGKVTTAMPGAVVRVLVAPGDVVQAGQVLVVVEAMKMENEFKAPFAAKVVDVPVKPGVAVEAGTLLVELVAAD